MVRHLWGERQIVVVRDSVEEVGAGRRDYESGSRSRTASRRELLADPETGEERGTGLVRP